MQLASDLSTNMPNLRKSLTVPKKTGHVTERLSQNIVLQFVATFYVEEYFSGHLKYVKALLRCLLRSDSVHNFMNVSRSFLLTFSTNCFRQSPLVSYI